jgi:hypothetical protein
MKIYRGHKCNIADIIVYGSTSLAVLITLYFKLPAIKKEFHGHWMMFWLLWGIFLIAYNIAKHWPPEEI